MNMLDWARNEIEIACKKEAPDLKDNEWDYGCACYQSALKAYESLCDDGHSGESMGITRNILMRLCDGLPLTPITDEDFDAKPEIVAPEEYLKDARLRSSKQCNRMSSLFRDEDLDGNVFYTDVNRVEAIYIYHPTIPWHNKTARSIVDKLFPIELPYYPSSKHYQVFMDDFLYDQSFGDFDTQAILYIITPEGKTVEINKFYKEVLTGVIAKPKSGSESELCSSHCYRETEWVEISEEEYNYRKQHQYIPDIVLN